MSNDHIVEEVRRVRHEMAEKCGYDIRKIVDFTAAFVRDFQASHPKSRLATP